VTPSAHVGAAARPFARGDAPARDGMAGGAGPVRDAPASAAPAATAARGAAAGRDAAGRAAIAGGAGRRPAEAAGPVPGAAGSAARGGAGAEGAGCYRGKRVASWLAGLVAAMLGGAAVAETSAEARARAPELFDAAGLRIDRQRAPTPDDVPGGRVLDPEGVRAAQAAGALLIDVSAEGSGEFFDGEWIGYAARETIPGAVWLPRVGFAAPEPELEAWFAAALDRLTEGDRGRALVFFCIVDCWLSWNAVQRAERLGWANGAWAPLGADGWRDRGWPLAVAEPYRLD
jgi:PQQ-dependent catabolism-associated CXXCW motif protein